MPYNFVRFCMCVQRERGRPRERHVAATRLTVPARYAGHPARQFLVVLALLAFSICGYSQEVTQTNKQPALVSVTQLDEVVVVGKLDEARQQIVPSLGATTYTVTSGEIEGQSQGEDAPFNHVLLRLPGVSQDSASSGQLHIRDDHANVQYRINDVLIPEGITGFNTEFDTRFVDKFDLITGALPAQYGYRTSGIVDIHTKSGAFKEGGDVSMYGGSYDTVHPSFSYAGSEGKLNYYFSGSYQQDSLGIENPTSATSAIHDNTEQYRGFAYLSYVLDESSRLSLIAGVAQNHFEIPNTPGQPAGTDAGGNPIPGAVSSFDSAALRETQDEQNDYAVLAYQKTLDDLDFQLSVFTRYSSVQFNPDWAGDYYFNGTAGSIDKSLLSNGLQFDSSYHLTDSHTLRGGIMFNAQGALQQSDTMVYPVDGSGNAIGLPFHVTNRSYDTAYFYGFYLQDEWKITKDWTVNFGGRADFYQSSMITQDQLSPRINTTYEIGKSTALHAGYASYFTPPPLENAPVGAVSQFAGTSNAATPGLPNGPVMSERDHYFDVGLTHKFTREYQVGIDGYYKIAQNLLDDGQFGAAPILSAFNYRYGEIYGLELSNNYTKDGFTAYGNMAYEHGTGTGVNSAQAVLFNNADYNYINSHSVYLDHDQRFTASAGVSCQLNETRPYVEVIVGSGLRTDATAADGSNIPNGASLPVYDNVNIGFEQTFKFAGLDHLKARFDIINLFDQIYQLRDGSGIGVGASQYGARRGFYGGLTWEF